MERRHFLQAASFLLPLPMDSGQVGILPETSVDNYNKSLPINDLKDPMQPVYLPPMPPLNHNGSMNIRTLIRSTMTNGVYTSVECAVAPKTMGPPPHFHKELDELMYVIEGTASVVVDGKEVQIEAGGWHLRPRLLPHTFWNASEKPLRFVDMYFNQPFEEFLERIFFELTPEKGYPFGSEKRQKEHDKLNEQFGLVYAETAGQERQTIIEKYGLK
jgi:mannose-6-phosphate isomerase-like protein (cupin superfamily)